MAPSADTTVPDAEWPAVLHVIDAASPGAGPGAVRIAAAVAAESPRPSAMLLLGPASFRAAAVSILDATLPSGRSCFASVGPLPIAGDPTWRFRALRRAIRGLERERGAFDRLVAWGIGAAAALALAAPRRRRLLVSSCGAVLSRRLDLLRRVGPGGLACLDDDARRSFAAAGFGPVARLPLPSAAFRPAPDAEARRRALRRDWAVADGTLAIGLLGDDPRWSDLRRAIDVVGFAAAAGVPAVIVASPRAARLAPSVAWTRRVREFSVPGLGRGEDRLWIVDPRVARPWETMPGLDAAILPGDGVATAGAAALGERTGLLGRAVDGDASPRPAPVPISPLAAACCAAAGVPMLVEATGAPAELADATTAVRFDRNDRHAGTRAILALGDDRAALAGLAADARSRVAALHPSEEAASRWRSFLSAG